MMIVLHEGRPRGRVDDVPGVFYVATQWIEEGIIPLYPLGSVLVFYNAPSDANSISIGFSAKSIWLTRLRSALVLLCLVCGVFVAAYFGRPEPAAVEAFRGSILALAVVMGLFGLTFSPLVRRPSLARATQLARIAGLSDAEVAEVGQIAMANRWTWFRRRPPRSTTQSSTPYGVRWRETPDGSD